MDKSNFVKVIVQPPPSSSSSSSSKRTLVAAAITYFSHKLVIAAQGDKSWTPIAPRRQVGNFRDIIFHGEKLFALGRSGWVLAYDISDPSHPAVSFMVQPPGNIWDHIFYNYKFLVEPLSGHVLLVSYPRRIFHRSKYSMPTPVIGVFKMDPTSNAKEKWIEVKSLGDHAIFLDCGNALILPAQEFSEIKRNFIYIASDSYGICTVPMSTNHYDMKDGTFTQHEPSADYPPLWFTPIIKY